MPSTKVPWCSSQRVSNTHRVSAIVSLLLIVFIAWQTALAFICGAACSMLAGLFGMQAATQANVRTSQAAVDGGQAKALGIAFSGGAVMGLSVASLGLVGLASFFPSSPGQNPGYISGFAMGASSIALFARVGGGIYTKAADVGSDLVGKLEAGIPEDDPRNPGVIADNVGDCVGDTAGMGADIFESYVGSIVAAHRHWCDAGSTCLGVYDVAASHRHARLGGVGDWHCLDAGFAPLRSRRRLALRDVSQYSDFVALAVTSW